MNNIYKWLLVAVALTAYSCKTTQPEPAAVPTVAASTPKSDFKPFLEIIPEGTPKDEGLFNVYHKDDKLYFEIPNDVLGREMLLVTRIAKIQANLSAYLNAGSKTGEQVVRWERRGKQVHLKVVSFSNIAPETDPISLSVMNNNLEPIIYAFDIEALGPDSTSVLIETSKFYTDDIPALSGLNAELKRQYKVRRMDSKRSYLDTARSFPTNVEVTHTQTFTAEQPPANSKTQTLTMQMNQSMILLPEEPMMPRLYDERVGWFTVNQIDYSSPKLKADRKTYIRRWQLVPKDKEAYKRGELVEPENPIVYYLDPATPEKFRPYFKAGIELWQEAFEAAGFKNAIIAKDPPTAEEDPDFSPEDARYSVVRYVASTTRAQAKFWKAT